jgi:tetratricopeptide (TPR) repeat protein
MQNTWEYIENYFTRTLSSEERKKFEKRIEQDGAFAKEVAFYLTARSAAHEVLMEEKQRSFAVAGIPVSKTAKPAPVRRMQLRKWLPYVAAACLILVIALYFIFQSPTPAQLAASYVHDTYNQLSLTMDASRDSMQLGIAAYNNQQYALALSYFGGMANSHPESYSAKKFAGLSYLQLKDYDHALEQFKSMAAMKGLFSNEGDFLMAVTLLLRNANGDKEQAKALLRKVVNEKEDSSDKAKEWLDKW